MFVSQWGRCGLRPCLTSLQKIQHDRRLSGSRRKRRFLLQGEMSRGGKRAATGRKVQCSELKNQLAHRAYNPSVTSAQRSTALPLRDSITAGSTTAGCSCPVTAVATIASQRSLNATDSADLPGRLAPPIE